MLGHFFYHGLIHKYVVVFGTIFNDLKIVREDTVHNTSHTINVPISYGPREKVLARMEADPELKRPAIQLPRMTFELENFTYDGIRKLPSTGRRAIADDTDIKFQYNPVPYDFHFVLNIISKNVDDAWRIIEQILPFFTPEFTVNATLIEEMDETRDIPIILNTTDLTDLYEGNFEERRMITAAFRFTMKAWLFGPVRTGSTIITMANTNFYSVTEGTAEDAVGNLEVSETFSVTPGQTANGEATSDAALTINRNSIAPDSDWGYVTTANTQ